MLTALALALVTKLNWVPVEHPEGYVYCGFTEMGLAFRKGGSYMIRTGPNRWFKGEMPWPNLRGSFSILASRDTAQWGTYRVDFSKGTPTWINVGEKTPFSLITEETAFEAFYKGAVVLDWNSSTPIEKSVFDFPPFEKGVNYRYMYDNVAYNSYKIFFQASTVRGETQDNPIYDPEQSYVFDLRTRTVTTLPKKGTSCFTAKGFFRNDVFGFLQGDITSSGPAALVNGKIKHWPLSTFQPLVGNEPVRAGFIESMSPNCFTGVIYYGRDHKFGDLRLKSFLIRDGKLDVPASQAMNQFETIWNNACQNYYLTPTDEVVRVQGRGSPLDTEVPLILVRK